MSTPSGASGWKRCAPSLRHFPARLPNGRRFPTRSGAGGSTEPVFIAFRDHEPVGIMGLMRQRSSKMGHRATIVMVYVRENLRGAGLATALLDALTRHARELGIRRLELSVNAGNPAAVGFYRRQGFAEIDRIAGGFLHEGKEIDKIMMARRIDG